MPTTPRPSAICLGLLAVLSLAMTPDMATAAEDDAGRPSVLDDSDQAVPANQLYPFRHDGPIVPPMLRAPRSTSWTIITPRSWRWAMAWQLGRCSFDDEVEESVLFIR